MLVIRTKAAAAGSTGAAPLWCRRASRKQAIEVCNNFCEWKNTTLKDRSVVDKIMKQETYARAE
jgi:hypothetical protein